MLPVISKGYINVKGIHLLHVRGGNKHELYAYLTQGDGIKDFKGSIKWNFTKFLIGKKGNIVGRFSPNTKPEELEDEILKNFIASSR
jgi:glutathione peroxidase